jgi:hypothetical protein
MAFFKNLFGKANELKESVEQKEITTKINDLYESIVKGVEELNAKVNSVKELKEKLKALPPPPPPTPSPPENSDKAMNSSEEDPEKTKRKQEEIRKQKEEEEKNKVAPPVAREMSDVAPLAPLAPLAPPAQADSPLPMPGAPADLTTPNPLDFEGGKKRKLRAKGKRATISKNKNETNTGKRTRKNRNSNKESTPESIPESTN